MLTRTDSGLAIEHQFYDVDLVVYCEGDVQSNDNAKFDAHFWSTVLRRQHIRCYCKSVGNKTAVKTYVEKITVDKVKNLAVAMDKDYDEFFGEMIVHPRIFYTYGYSWESDAIALMQFEHVLALFLTTPDTDHYERLFWEFFYRQSIDLRKAVILDLKYFKSAQKLFDRRKPQSIIQAGQRTPPFLRKGTLVAKAKTILEKFEKPMHLPHVSQICGMTSFFGKTVAYLAFHWFRHLRGARQIDFNTFITAASISAKVDSSRPAGRHYMQLSSASLR